MSRYAEHTSVSVDRSQGEIRGLVMKHGANGFMCGEANGQAGVTFELRDRRIRFTIPMPSGKEKNADQVYRQRWRVLVLLIKGKLKAVEEGAGFDEEFLAYTVMPNQQTFGQWAIPQLDAMMKGHKMPPLLITGPQGGCCNA